MGCNLLMSLAYAIIAGKESYINNRLVDSATYLSEKGGWLRFREEKVAD